MHRSGVIASIRWRPYLCELKKPRFAPACIGWALDPEPETFVELLLAISRAPAAELEGMTQRLANLLNLEVDPWGDEDGQPLSDVDQKRLRGFTQAKPRRVTDAVAQAGPTGHGGDPHPDR